MQQLGDDACIGVSLCCCVAARRVAFPMTCLWTKMRNQQCDIAFSPRKAAAESH